MSGGLNLCGMCRFFQPHAIWMEGDSESLKRWGSCGNPKLDFTDVDNGLVHAGGSDGDGDYWHITKDFGCIFFEAKV